MKNTVFLDRDGTINKDTGYLDSPDKLVLLDGALDAIKLLNDLNVRVIVITNQSGIGRGYLSSEVAESINLHLNEILDEGGAKIDAFYYCPHHPDECCNCRKPKTGLIESASKDHDIDPSETYLVGDKVSDIELAYKIGSKAILVLTGYGIEHMVLLSRTPDFVAKNILDAVNWIIKDINKNS